ncbi:hypothetical protein BJ875DRAFT_182736 [Amylocarpus encephaloides]|uniref:CAP-Gly domain-containing protein n=1 Tax=Amylocarpus encephaloides TaxID=45428 RepID=A0A9P7Y972_9HELO|nr:hypothetical protein BJ875DRAFT_182736 [Amylocarpus encephaloides]
MSTTLTPRRALARPSLGNSINTTSSPNLRQIPSNGHRANALAQSLNRKSSLSALTLSTIPDNSKGYALSAVLDENTHPGARKMAPFTPSRESDGEDLDVGDVVDVPGNMFGTVKFVGTVAGKKGLFAGVELSEDFASRGKNNGDVDGISYFQTQVPGAGIFLPINRATRRGTPPTRTFTPSTPSAAGSSFKTGGRTYTPPTPSLPKFSQSVGPGRAPSPGFKKSRPSLPRPESPLRRPQLSGRPSISTPTAKAPPRYASPAPGKFGQSVRGTKDLGDPSKRVGYTPRSGMSGMKASVGPRSASALGNTPMNISEDEATPVGVARTTTNASVGSVSSFSSKMRPASRAASRAASGANDDESDRLRAQLEERDRQLKEQASSLAEMENALAEVQSLMGAAESPSRHNRGSLEDKDSSQLRVVIREKNEKIAMLTAEFDAHRADFRSTIDTLELASTETERVYEKRVEDLLSEVREYQDRTDDVDSVARQLKQLEELVQELEEGLEDARRGEAEARGEVEFLRGEVERTRSELRREREKSASAFSGTTVNGESSSTSKEVEQRDDEIRGLKAIIHSLSRDAVPDTVDLQKTPTQRQGNLTRLRQVSSGDGLDDRLDREKLERELKELRIVVESKTNREDELERELERVRRGSASHTNNQRSSALTIGSTGTITQDYSSPRDSKGTVISWRDRDMPRSPETHRRGNTLETMPESDTYSSAAESFCELCETSGHDILTCTNMFTSHGKTNNSQDASATQKRTGKDVVKEGLKLSPHPPHDDYKPAPLSPLKKSPDTTPAAIIPNPMESGPVAGKESGVINMEKWCGVCEREGHDSIDCPFEDAF